MKREKSIEKLQSKQLGNFAKVYGSKIFGGSTTYTIATVVITVPKKSMSLSDGCPEDVNCPNDGSDN